MDRERRDAAGTGPKDRTGQCLQVFAASTPMCAVNTLVPRSPAYTYTANSGQRHRIDYVMATQQGMQA
eukprot:7590284-Pyramimonas_sp.AAC.1